MRIRPSVVGVAIPSPPMRSRTRRRHDHRYWVALIDILEQKRLVERKRDPLDRRGYRVHLTAKSVGVIARAVDAIDAVEHDFLDGLSCEEQRQFRTLLGRVVLHREPGVASSPLTQK
jgi:hypothetical protein